MRYDGFLCSTEECFLKALVPREILTWSFFCFLSDAARESPAEYLSFLPLSSSLSSPFYFSTLQYQLYQIPPSLLSGLSWKLPARADSLCWYVEREKEGEEKWRRCGEKESSLFFFSALIISPLDSPRKTKQQRFTYFLSAVFIFSSFIFKSLSIRTKQKASCAHDDNHDF